MNTYLTIKSPSEGIYKEKGSRFIAYAYPVNSVVEAKNILDELKKKFYDARHICYAYSIGPEALETRANDDGEPSGTGGKPIQGVLLSNNITNVLIAVVRYFGGVKLGTGGLIQAYRAAAADAIENNEIIEKIVEISYTISYDYLQMNEVMKVIKEQDCQIVKQNFELRCEIEFDVSKANQAKTFQLLSNINNLSINELE